MKYIYKIPANIDINNDILATDLLLEIFKDEVKSKTWENHGNYILLIAEHNESPLENDYEYMNKYLIK